MSDRPQKGVLVFQRLCLIDPADYRMSTGRTFSIVEEKENQSFLHTVTIYYLENHLREK